jgi:flavin-binding monooxygenase-like protein
LVKGRVAIIGGGPAGLMQAYACQKLGIPYTLFERNADFGGLWNRDDPASPVYDSAHLISSRTMTGFDGYPMPEDWPDYPPAALVLQYIRDFAHEFGLYDHTAFNESVESAVPVDGGWRLKTSTGRDETFGYLIAANGSNWKPILPDWPGEFSGTLRHAASFKNADEVRDKRVLVVGLGNSGVDIACDASRTAKSVHVSIRRGYHVVPKHILGKPADVFADTAPPAPFWLRRKISQMLLRVLTVDMTRFGMPKPDHQLLETHPLLSDQFIHHLSHGDVTILGDVLRFDGDQVTFKDGHQQDFDEIICATGFEWEIPYIDPALLPWQRGRLAPPLAIFPEVENLFLLSFVESNGSSFSLFNEMAWIIARSILTAQTDAAAYAKLRNIVANTKFDLTNGLKMQDTDRHVGYLDNPTYRRALKKLRRMMGWPKVETT